MEGFWYTILGVFIGGIGTLITMSILEAGSMADDILLSEKQYYED